LPTSNAATRWMIWSLSRVSSSTPASLCSTSNGRLPAGAAGRQANLIRVLKATVKGPGAAPSTRLINGLQRPRTSGISGQPPRFSPRNGRHPQGGTAAYQQSRAYRHADQHLCRSLATVRGEVMRCSNSSRSSPADPSLPWISPSPPCGLAFRQVAGDCRASGSVLDAEPNGADGRP
jgi:hypothetical protein